MPVLLNQALRPTSRSHGLYNYNSSITIPFTRPRIPRGVRADRVATLCLCETSYVDQNSDSWVPQSAAIAICTRPIVYYFTQSLIVTFSYTADRCGFRKIYQQTIPASSRANRSYRSTNNVHGSASILAYGYRSDPTGN
jgi:hypothetical protein